MIVILVFLFVLSLLLTRLNYRLSLFMFPDGVFIHRFHGFLGWYGFTNLFVSIPFLWDGDIEQGIIPFILGALPLLTAIICVFRQNSGVNVSYRHGLKVFMLADEDKCEPGNETFGFLDNSFQRMKEIGPKFFFKELFAREKENRILADILLEEGALPTLNAITVLPWVQDKAVSVKAQIVFLFHYMIARYDRQKLITNFDSLSKSVIELCKLADLSFKELPYPVAVFIAQTNSLLVTLDKDEPRFELQLEGYDCAEGERVAAQFIGHTYLAPADEGIFSRLKHYYALNYKARRCYVTFTNQHVIIRIDGMPDEVLALEASSGYKRVFSSVTFDGRRFFKFFRSKYFKFVVDILNN